MEEKKRDIEKDLLPILVDSTHLFSVKNREFSFYPMTLAKMYAMRPIMERLGVSEKIMLINPFFEVLRLAKAKPDECIELITLFVTPNNKAAYHDRKERSNRFSYLKKHLKTEAVAMLLMYCLSEQKLSEIEKYLTIDVEKRKKAKVMEIKARTKNKNNISFGGKSIFGAFFVQLRELGYTDDEILFERPYAFLQLMLADKMDSVYVTDEEAESIPTWAGGTLILADSADNREQLLKMLSERGFTVDNL